MPPLLLATFVLACTTRTVHGCALSSITVPNLIRELFVWCEMDSHVRFRNIHVYAIITKALNQFLTPLHFLRSSSILTLGIRVHSSLSWYLYLHLHCCKMRCYRLHYGLHLSVVRKQCAACLAAVTSNSVSTIRQQGSNFQHLLTTRVLETVSENKNRAINRVTH